MEGETPVCFWKGKISDFTERNPTFKWFALHNDEAVGKVDE
jgi:hypothetical protein